MSLAPPRPTAAAATAVAPPAWPVSLRAVVRRGVRDQWRAVVGWGAALGALGAFMAAIYPSIRVTIEQVATNYRRA